MRRGVAHATAVAAAACGIHKIARREPLAAGCPCRLIERWQGGLTGGGRARGCGWLLLLLLLLHRRDMAIPALVVHVPVILCEGRGGSRARRLLLLLLLLVKARTGRAGRAAQRRASIAQAQRRASAEGGTVVATLARLALLLLLLD